MYKIAERFVSINGEGTHAGETAAFIRFKGCNLNCTYCDTRWANGADAPFESAKAEELADWVSETGVVNVTLTGGEPLLQDNIGELVELLVRDGRRVEIETNGSVSISQLAQSEFRPVFTMDYKLPVSGMERFMDCDNFRFLEGEDTVKFVAGSLDDLHRARLIMDEYDLVKRCNVYISPVFGSIDPAEIVGYMIANRLNGIRLQLQLHKYIWDPGKRGV